MPRPKSPWNSGVHLALQRLWNERIAPTGMTQEEFGERYGLGSQSMVSQYLMGTRPLHYDAAERFAEGFRCTIADICPDMADRLARDFFPKLGRVLPRGKLRRRIAGVVIAAIALAPILHNSFSYSEIDSAAFGFGSVLILIACLRWLSAMRQLAVRFSDSREKVKFALAV